MDVEVLARCLFVGKEPRVAEDADATMVEVVRLARLVVRGSYVEVIGSTTARQWWEGLPARGVVSSLRSRLSTSESHDPCLVVGVAALLAFAQANFTGPDLSLPVFALGGRSWEVAVGELESDGEICSRQCRLPDLLHFSRELIRTACASPTSGEIAAWWGARVAICHQSILADRSPTLRDLILPILSRIVKEEPALTSSRHMHALACLELGHMEHVYLDDAKAQGHYREAQRIIGLDVELTGKMGVRTKHQTFKTAQLVLAVKASELDEGGECDGACVPCEVEFDDPDIYGQPKVEEGDESKQKGRLTAISQAVLLALCANVKNQNPKDGLTTEEMWPYVNTVLEKSNNWLVHSMGLLVKSRLEEERTRTVEHGILQMQALVDQFNDESPPANERLPFVFAVAYPSRWQLERELGVKFMRLGVAASAMAIFERLEMWEEVIDCLVIMSKHKEAEEVIKKQLAIKETPSLWCKYGEVTAKEEYHQKAWDLSHGRFARAKRSMGRLALMKREFKAAALHFSEALAINPLFPGIWFSLGCSFMSLNQWTQAINAFTQVVHLEPENAEAFSNMGSCYIQLDKNAEAYHTLTQALKYAHENWRIWENYTIVCIETHHFQQASHAMTRVLELKGSVDTTILRILVDVATNDKTPHGLDAEALTFLGTQVEDLLRLVTQKITKDPHVWSCCVRFWRARGDHDKEIDALVKQCRALQRPGWESDPTALGPVSEGCLELCRAYQADGSPQNLHAAYLYLRSIVKRAEATFGGQDISDYERLVEELRIVEQRDRERRP